MNILLASLNYKPEIGGIENSISYMSKTLKSLGHNVKIITGDKSSSSQNKYLSYEVIGDTEIFRFKRMNLKISLFKIFEIFFDLISCYFFIKKNLSKNDFDIVISRNYILSICAFKIFSKSKKIYIPSAIQNIIDQRQIEEFNGNYPIKLVKFIFYKYFLLNIFKIFEKNAAIKADQVIVFSKVMKRQFRHYLNQPDLPITILQPGVDNTKFTKSKKSISDPIFPRDKFKFLILSRLIKLKGIDLVIKSFCKISSKDVLLMIVGDGPELNNLKCLVEKNNAHDRIKFFNSTQNPEYYFNNVDTFILSSVYESFGQTILEALSAGLPIIAFNSKEKGINTATNEIVENNFNGVLCEYTIDGLLKGIESILNLGEQISEISNRNRNKVLKDYTWERFCNEIINHEKTV